MNQIQLMEIAQQVIFYLSPLIATGAITKVGEDITDATKALAQRTWDLISEKFKGKDESTAALTLYKANPENKARQEIIKDEIIKNFEGDEHSINSLLTLVQEAKNLNLLVRNSSQFHNLNISDDAIVGNAVSGNVQGSISVDMGIAEKSQKQK